VIELDATSVMTLNDVEAVACDGAAVAVSSDGWSSIEQSHAFMQREAKKGRRIYGVTTGFGPLADHYLHPDDAAELQRNLVYHLATGVGEPFTTHETRAIMLARLASLARGYSAVDPAAVTLLTDCLNCGLVPIVPSLGTVGASGDLTPLAHVALALMGEAPFWEGDLESAGLQPLEPSARECLGLVNGTSAMTGLAALSGAEAERALDAALSIAAANAEVFRANRSAFHPLLGGVRPHVGQIAVLERLQALFEGARRLNDTPAQVDLDALRAGPSGGNVLAQDPYSIRCVPQLLGAIADQVTAHNETVQVEFNSVTDNPLFDGDSETIVHGGNFMGQHVSFASDALNNALIQLAVHAERVIARLVDNRRNGDLPPFLHGGRAGLHSGFMGAQVTASALVAQLRTHSHPASIQSISTNADNQDVVSMGTIAALRVRQTLDRVFEVLAIEAMVVAQAMDLSGDGFSPAARRLAARVRHVSPALEGDRPLSGEIARVAQMLRRSDPPE
jgi:tyrosine ammonia-lyase